jgi:NADPH:quinone reductase-like Zn-dependent oxidoreductase
VLALYAARIDPDDPLSAMEIAERPEPEAPAEWATVTVRAASLNHHDLWSLRGVGLKESQLPMILGSDAAGVDADGRKVVVHSVFSDPAWRGDETFDPGRSIPSERYQGTFAEQFTVPARNLLALPENMSFEEAACLPTAYLTAYRMLFTRAGLKPGQTILVQGASGGMATALILLASAAGIRVWVTGRSEEKQAYAQSLGADATFAPGARLPDRVDAVMETVGADTWAHSLKSLKPGGTVVICGATSGDAPPAMLTRIFFLQLSVVGSSIGTREEFAQLLEFCAAKQIKPVVKAAMPLAEAREGVASMLAGDLGGKIVFTL